MLKVCFMNGSLRGEEAATLAFIKAMRARIDARLGARLDAGIDAETIGLMAASRQRYTEETLQLMAKADAIVLAFPLFTYSLSGALTRLLEEFQFYVAARGDPCARAKVYAVVNCGFPDARICEEAIRVVVNFCARLDLEYRFSIAIGGGPVTVLTSVVRFLNPGLKRAFAAIGADIRSAGADRPEDRYFNPIIPRPIMLWIKGIYEKKMMARA